MITYLLDTLVNSIKTSLINKLGLDPSTEVDLDDFPQLIDDIPILDSVEELTVTENGTYTGTGGVTYNPVNVNLPLGTKTITANGTYTASDDSLQGYSSVTVDIDDTDLYRDTTDSTYESVKTLSNCGAFPMLSLTAEINAVQDLHGYDKPWAGGANVNKFDTDTFYSSYKQSDGSYRMGISPAYTTHCNIPSSLVGVACVFSGYLKLDENTTLTNVRPVVNVGGTNINGTVITSTDYTTFTLSFTPTSTSDYIYIGYGSGGGYIQMKELQLEAGTTATTYSPYSNICPISGWDEAVISVSPLNIAPLYNGQIYGDGRWISSDMRLTNVSSGQDNSYFLKAGTYTLDYDKLNSNAPSLLQCSALTKDDSYTIIDNFATAWNSLPFTFTLTQDGYLYFTIRKDADTTLNVDDYKAKVVKNTYTIDLDGTRYGGKVDLVSGVMTVDRAYVDLGDLNWTYANGFFQTLDLNSTIKRPANNYAIVNAISSMYKAESWNAISGTSNGKFAVSTGASDPLIVCNTSYTDATAFKTAMNGVQLVYELATPTTATSDAIDLTLAEGVNNIWADSGDVGDARYFKKVEL